MIPLNPQTPEDYFKVWAPSESVWSKWVKPVIFAQIPQRTIEPVPAARVEFDLSSLPGATDHTALVVNLEADNSVQAALALVQRGYRPVPLYNCWDGPGALIPLAPVLNAMVTATDSLRQSALGPDAPPAFMIDANRIVPQPVEGRFDNRWIVFPQDFPSAIFFRSQGIEQVILLQRGIQQMQEDLFQVLLLWNKGGLRLLKKDPFQSEAPQSIDMSLPTRIRMGMGSRFFLISTFGLRRSGAGGFGAYRPTSANSYG